MLPTDPARRRDAHPLDVVERLACDGALAFDREHRDEVAVVTKGAAADYHVAFTWLPHCEALHVACAFDLHVPDAKRGRVLELISLVNQELWVGHFDLWARDGALVFRQTLLLAGGAEATGAQCAALLDAAVESCDRFHSAFQFVLWSALPPAKAYEAALMRTVGHA